MPQRVLGHFEQTAASAGYSVPEDSSLAWQVTVSRLELRKCGPPEHVGLDVRLRWQAGTGAGAVSGTFRVQPECASAEGRPWPDLQPGEYPLSVAWHCRPVAAYCSAAGAEDVLLDDLAAAIHLSRDWMDRQARAGRYKPVRPR